MPRLTGIVVCCALSAAQLARANEIVLWQGAAGDCEINQYVRTVTIHAPGTFKVEALDGSGGLGIIRSIAINFTGDPGPVTVYIVRDPTEVGGAEHEPGAAEVWGLDLSPATGGGTVAELRTTGNYGHPDFGAALQAGGAGTIVLGENATTAQVLNPISVTGDVTEALTVGGQLLAALTITGAAPDISLVGTGTHTGDITLYGAYAHTLHIAGPHSGAITLLCLVNSEWNTSRPTGPAARSARA